MSQTNHASVRAQQRCIPPLVDRLLDEFGEMEHDGHGCVKLFLAIAASKIWSARLDASLWVYSSVICTLTK